MFSEQLKNLRLEKGISQKELGNRLFLSQQTIAKYENGFASPNPETLTEIAKVFKVSVDYLVGETKNKHPIFDLGMFDNLIPISTQKIPLLGDIACGEPIYANEDFESYVEVGTNIKADFALRCKGDSMINARIKDGDIVFIKKQPTVNNGEIACVLIDDEATLKRVYLSENTITLVAENPVFPPLTFSKNDGKNIVILGKAIAFQSDL